MPPILPLRTGWDPVPGGPDEYPSDLPPDWRLAYFASAYWGVLVPCRLWCRAGAAQARTWVEETPPRFRIFLDLDQAPDLGREEGEGTLAPLCAELGERLGGLVGYGSALEALPGSGPGSCRGPARLLRIPAVDMDLPVPWGLGSAWEVPVPLRRDLRGARAWIEARVRQGVVQSTDQASHRGTAPPLVVLLGECPFEDLSRWQTLLELMGCA